MWQNKLKDFIQGMNVDLRKIQPSDAQFVVTLRTDPMLSKYLNPIDSRVEKQKEWIQESLLKNEWYYVVQNKIGERVGLIRGYEWNENSFSFGSFIILPKARLYATFESAILFFETVFNETPVTFCNIFAKKNNFASINLSSRMGAEIVQVDSEYVYSQLTKKRFLEKLSKNKDPFLRIFNRYTARMFV